MHWAERIADELISENPGKEEFLCAAGTSPSGRVHIGNFRDIATPYFVVRALRAKGKKARLMLSWDDFDRLRKVPKNVTEITTDFDKYIGMPYCMIPDPEGKYSSYAEANEKEYERSLEEMGIDIEYRYQGKEYTSGRYVDGILTAMHKRKEIYDILMKYKTQDSDEGERETYYPLGVYCSCCGKDFTEIISYDENTEDITYRCKVCGKTETVNLKTYHMVKLAWKIDWPMRWGVEGVDFEPGGIDHAAASGSYVVAKDIAKEIFGIKAPKFQPYGWLSIAGLGDMHSSTGNNITPATVLEVYEPEMIRWLFAKYAPTDGFAFNFDDTIIRHYSEFDKGLEAVRKGEADEYNRSVYELCMIGGLRERNKVPFGVLASVATIVDFKPSSVKDILAKIGVDFDENDEERLIRVKNWITKHQPSKMYKLLAEKNEEFYSTLNDEEKAVVRSLYDHLSKNESFTEQDIQQYLYSIINKPELSKKENTVRQQRFFSVFYNLLFGTDKGPRLYLFLCAIDKSDYLRLLEF
ncbi:MAG: lysine--tRNA ligase [Clostridia bacterium]|nr:lysine--tRNA ligase [Clostridia bacterium]